ncbi:hypothetical protein D3C80_2096870 [compost metagenome]
MGHHHQRRGRQRVVVEMVLGIPGAVEARLLRDHGLLDRVLYDLLRTLVIATLLREDEYAEFHGGASLS